MSSFLDSLDRVTSLKYVPSDGKSSRLVTEGSLMATIDDILRARLKTLGVSEHRFKFKAGKATCYNISTSSHRLIGNMVAHDWKVFDVGGARSLVRIIGYCLRYCI
jgi:hypothetical protein